MVEFIIKYVPLIGGIGAVFSLLVKIMAMFKSTEIEKQLENNIQRTIRDIKNICTLFICFLLIICGLYAGFNQDKNSINFSVSDLKYYVSGNISKNIQSVIFVVNNSEQTIELKNKNIV